MQAVIQNIVSGVNRGNRTGGEVIGGTIQASARCAMPIRYDTGFMQLLESALSGTFGSYIATSAITGTFAASGSTFTRAAGSFFTDAKTARLRQGDKVAVTGTANQGTALNGAVASTSSTTLTVDDTTMFPSTGAILIDSEWILYTGKTSTTFTGCTRGAFASTAATHADNAAVVPVKTIASITATVITFSEACVNESSISTTFTTRKKQLFGGTTRVFGTLQRQHPDTATAIIDRARGAEVNTAQLTHGAGQETTAQFDFLANDITAGEAASSTYTAASSNTAMSGTVANTVLLIDDVATNTCIENFQLNINNNRANKYGLGSQYACFVEEGNRDVTVQIAAYRVDRTFLNYAVNGTRFAIEFVIRDQTKGHAFRYVMGTCVVESDPGGTSGQTKTDTPTIRAEYDSYLDTNILIEALLNQ